MYQSDGCMGSLPADEYTAAHSMYCRRLYLCGSYFSFPGIFQYYPYTQLAVNFHYSADDSYRISDAMADKGGKNSDKTTLMTGFCRWSVVLMRPGIVFGKKFE